MIAPGSDNVPNQVPQALTPEVLADSGKTGETAAHCGTQAEKPEGVGLVIRNLEGVEPEPVEWIWPGRLPAGMLTVIAGDPGGGKSTLAAYIAGVVTTGKPWIDGPSEPSRKPGRVLFLTAEDDTTRVLVPRLIAAGADRSLIDVIEGVRLTHGSEPEPFCLDRDLPRLRDVIRANADTLVVVIDPVTAYLGKAARDSHNTAVMRGLLAPLKQLSETLGVGVLAISHLNKAQQVTNATYRVNGSLALAAHARAVYLVAAHPEDRERRLLATAKINVGPNPPTLAFRLVGDPPRIEWESEPVDLSSEELLRQDTVSSASKAGTANAESWLRKFLSHGPVKGEDAKVAAKTDGVSERCLELACKALAVVKGPLIFGGTWHWWLPHSAVSLSVPQSVSESQSAPQ